MIREVNLQDAASIAAIYNEYIEKTTATFETAPLSAKQMEQRIEEIAKAFPYFVYVSDNKVIGYAYAHKWKERAAFCDTLETTIYLDSQSRHRGIGKELMQHIIKECKLRGFRVLVACITAENTESTEFHKSLGFKQASLFHNVGRKFGRILDITDMELQL